MSLSLPHLVALARFGRMPMPLVFDLMDAAGGAEALWRASASEMAALGFVGETAASFIRDRGQIDPEREMERLAKEGIEAVAIDDPRYPDQLRQICDPPPVIFVRGSAAALATGLPVAVVGARRMSGYGQMAVKLIVPPLAAAGATIVSGLALGVDAAAHAAALEAGGLTVAVLGAGVERSGVGPRTNAGLAERLVAAGGALVSEYPPGTAPFKDHFPARNRIIAGLVRGVIVVEAADKSGSLITAARALDYNRDVFAVPGPIDRPAAVGPNRLLSRGAIPCCGAEDVLSHYGREPAAGAVPDDSHLGPDELLVMTELERGPLPPDALAEASGLAPPRLLAALTGLEIAGRIILADGAYSYIGGSRRK